MERLLQGGKEIKIYKQSNKAIGGKTAGVKDKDSSKKKNNRKGKTEEEKSNSETLEDHIQFYGHQ